jgi:hypothetical protein
MNLEQDNLKCIMSPHLAKILINSGFIVKDVKPNNQIKNSTVFLFEETEELNLIIEKYKEEREKKKNLTQKELE